MTRHIGIAGWPLRALPTQDLVTLEPEIRSDLIEIPKDLLDSISIKDLFRILTPSRKTLAFAGTTDFTNHAGFSWTDYRYYLDIQAASAHFLHCNFFRVFLHCTSPEEMDRAIARATEYAITLGDLEIVVETHGGFESTLDGFNRCIDASPFRFVVDFANIQDPSLAARILSGDLAHRIAYFHLRNFASHTEAPHLISVENAAIATYPLHSFLWEPKYISGREAVSFYINNAELETSL